MDSVVVDVDKIKLMYEHQRAQFSLEVERYRRLEEKATRYLASISFFVAAFFVVAKWAGEMVAPAKGTFDWVVLILLILTFGSFISSWSFCFRAARLANMVKLSAANDMVEYFLDNQSPTVLVGLSRKYSEAIISLEGLYNEKLDYVEKAYREISFSVGCFTLTVIVFLIRAAVNQYG
ncbi:hypothetical protein [Stenotrophomonas maltophilia]|uniref:hypothetical protein n=1 Tax=Stenotrophomonas maltophilia TaxID=40324 RepID=UPI0011B29EE1|nr:hypothetical protein [Stenotrophomonas maltophilia]